MKTIKTYFLIMIAACIFSRAKSQSLNSPELPSFSKIVIRDNSKINIHSGAKQIVSFSSDDASRVKTTVNEGKLTISGAGSEFDITLPELTSVEISGNGKVTADSVIKTQNLRLTISGNGKMEMPVDVQKLEIGISGSGKLELSGKADKLDLNISGNGKIDARDLVVNSCESNISGVGKSSVDVKNSLMLDITGSGSFYYKTKPAALETKITGIGRYGSYNANDDNNDTTSFNAGGKKIIIIGKDDNDYEGRADSYDDDDDGQEGHHRHSYHGNHHWHEDKDSLGRKLSGSHWEGIDLGFNTLMTSGFNNDLPEKYQFLELNSGKSVNVNINIFAHDFKLYKHNVIFTTGIGLTLNNYRFASHTLTLKTDTNKVVSTENIDKLNNLISYSKNKLAVNYVTVPLLLQFNTNEQFNKSFHIAAGLLLSYKYNSHLKLVHSDDGDRKKEKRQDEFNIDPFRYDATLRFGYREYTVYASYALSELFKNNRGPELHPFQFGISFSGW